MQERKRRSIAFLKHVSLRLSYSHSWWNENLTFDEVDCIGEPIDPSFAIGWPSFAFEVPLDNPLNL
jgi:methionyl-tRNA synthetase